MTDMERAKHLKDTAKQRAAWKARVRQDERAKEIAARKLRDADKYIALQEWASWKARLADLNADFATKRQVYKMQRAALARQAVALRIKHAK